MADQVGDEFDPLAEVAPPSSPNGAGATPVWDEAEFARNAEAVRQATEADPDEEPPEPEGLALSAEVAEYLGTKDYFHGPLPYDLAAIWGHPPFEVRDEATCRILVGAWGVEGFRDSNLHRAALQDKARQAVSAETRSRFKAEREKKDKKDKRKTK